MTIGTLESQKDHFHGFSQGTHHFIV